MRITLTIKAVRADNQAIRNHATALTPAPKLDRITVLEGSKVVWQSRQGLFTKARKIHSEQTIKRSAVWDGRPNHAAATKLTPGVYTIEADGDGVSATTTITIEPRRSNSHG